MEFRNEVRELLKEKKSWAEINDLIGLEEEELISLASGRITYQSGDNPLYSVGNDIMYYEDEETYGFGTISAVYEKSGEDYPEYTYLLTWNDGFTEVCWEQQVMDYIDNIKNYGYLR